MENHSVQIDNREKMTITDIREIDSFDEEEIRASLRQGAMVIRGELAGGRTFPARYVNTCWSLVDTDDAIKVGGRYEPKDGKIAATETFVSKPGESAELRKETQAENMGWYAGITADMFA